VEDEEMASSLMGIFTNPVLPCFDPDPFLIRVGSNYFCVPSSFKYFPGAPIYHSKNLIKWKLIGHALTRKSQLDIKTPEPGGGVWATTIRYHDGVFYIITNAFDWYRPQADERV
jgi:beta-xylosidase